MINSGATLVIFILGVPLAILITAEREGHTFQSITLQAQQDFVLDSRKNISENF
jgi:hypothetical protein